MKELRERAFAALYDTAFFLAERRGLCEIRRGLTGRASGRTLELGAGTGLNLEHYSETISELVLTEPNPYMATKLRHRVVGSLHTSVLEAPAEALPVEDSSFDTVISTLVFCTARDPRRAIAEVVRVLRPGGTFLFAEHVRSSSPRLARWQDRLDTSLSWCACGCHCNRDTLSTIKSSKLLLESLKRDRLPWLTPLVRPLVIGAATKGE